MSDNTILGIKPTSDLLSVTEAVLKIIQPIDEHCGVCDEQGIEEVVLTEALKPVDKSVIDAFYYKKERVAGNLLSTNGRSLEKHGMGGQTIAAWLKDKIAITAVSDVKSTEAILKYMKKSIPKGMFDPKSYKKFFGEEVEIKEALNPLGGKPFEDLKGVADVALKIMTGQPQEVKEEEKETVESEEKPQELTEEIV